MAYKLKPQIPGAELQFNANACASFTHYQLWGMPCDSKHRPSDGHINQAHPARLPVWVQRDCPPEDGDQMAWETLGCHDASIAADWPVLLTNADALILKPHHFCNRSPAMGLAG